MQWPKATIKAKPGIVGQLCSIATPLKVEHHDFEFTILEEDASSFPDCSDSQ